jgi:hypothetical protein
MKSHFCVDSGSGFACRSVSTNDSSPPGFDSTAVATAAASINSEPTSV